MQRSVTTLTDMSDAHTEVQSAYPPSPEFTAQANAICSHAEDERRQASTDVGEGEDSGDAAAVTEALVAPVKTMTEELGELGPPKGDAKQVKAIIAAFEAGIATLEADPAGPESATAFAEADELATAYGLTSCVI